MSEDLPLSLSRVVAAHVCESFGFHGVQRSALDTLTDVLVKFLTTAGEHAHQYAENAGRTEAHAGDVMAALQDLAPTSPADLLRFARFVEESSAPVLEQAVPSFPLPSQPQFATPSFKAMGEVPPPRQEIPEWLPAFPDAHTHTSTPAWEGLGSGGSEKRRERAREQESEEGRERRRGERSLVALHRRMAAVTADGGEEVSGALWGAWPLPGAGHSAAEAGHRGPSGSHTQGGAADAARGGAPAGKAQGLAGAAGADSQRQQLQQLAAAPAVAEGGGQRKRRMSAAEEHVTVGNVFGGLLTSAGGAEKEDADVEGEEVDSETEEELRAAGAAECKEVWGMGTPQGCGLGVDGACVLLGGMTEHQDLVTRCSAEAAMLKDRFFGSARSVASRSRGEAASLRLRDKEPQLQRFLKAEDFGFETP